MNNKGQTLALFVILIPLIIMLGAYVVDIGYMKYNKNKLDGINEYMVDYALDNKDNLNKEEIINMIIKNDDDINKINIDEIDNGVKIEISKTFKGLFGYFVGKDIYDARSIYKGSIIDEKKVIERVD